MHYFLKLVKFSNVNWNVHKALSTQFILFVVQTSHITYKGIFYIRYIIRYSESLSLTKTQLWKMPISICFLSQMTRTLVFLVYLMAMEVVKYLHQSAYLLFTLIMYCQKRVYYSIMMLLSMFCTTFPDDVV